MIRRIWSDYAAVAVGILSALTIVGVTAAMVFDSDDSCGFCPLRIQRLEVQPPVVYVGERATLLDGVCNDASHPVTASIYLGADSVNGPTFGRQSIPLLTKMGANGQRVAVVDTEEGRLSQLFQPGCSSTDPIEANVHPALTPGIWRLRVHIVAKGSQGEEQSLTGTSPPFEVRDR